MFSNNHVPYLHERDVGIFQANDKEVCMWFNVYDEKERLLHKDQCAYGLEWNASLYSEGNRVYLIGSQTFIMPYNLQNIVQHYRPASAEIGVENFYASDIYLLDGKIPMHKLKNSPSQLEMLIDQYWKEKPHAVLSVLVKE